MKYLMLAAPDRAALIERLAGMGAFLEERLATLDPDEATRPGPEGSFSPVEHCWHLADLEREGFGARIERLLAESEPRLPDFDGGRIARERRYRTRSLAEGLAAFRSARRSNLARLQALEGDAWSRAGTQDGVGRVMLCDLPSMMLEHDDAHRAEIEAWSRTRRGGRGDA